MSIIPVGTRKEQVAQGPLQNQSILDSVLFRKFGIGASGLLDEPKNRTSPPGDLQQAMAGGSLDHDGMADQLAQDRNPPPEAMQDQQPAIAPAGGAPADQFIGPTPVDQTQPGINPYEQEVQKIRQFIGYQNYGLELTPQKDGSLEVIVQPPPGQPVDIGQLMHGLKQVTQGDWKGESTPAMAQGGPIKLKYIPQTMGTPKIEKR